MISRKKFKIGGLFFLDDYYERNTVAIFDIKNKSKQVVWEDSIRSDGRDAFWVDAVASNGNFFVLQTQTIGGGQGGGKYIYFDSKKKDPVTINTYSWDDSDVCLKGGKDRVYNESFTRAVYVEASSPDRCWYGDADPFGADEIVSIDLSSGKKKIIFQSTGFLISALSLFWKDDTIKFVDDKEQTHELDYNSGKLRF